MNNFYRKETNTGIDTRKKRRFLKIIKKVQLISAVVIVWMVGLAFLYGIYLVVFIKPYFSVKDIRVQGDLSSLTKEDVIESSGLKIGDHLLRIPVSTIQKKLLSNPWVKEAAVYRKFPHVVGLAIKEYTPEAIVRLDDLYYVDRFGVVFKKIEATDNKNYPVITGVEKIYSDGSAEEFKSKLVELLKVKLLYEGSSLQEGCGLSEVHYNHNRGISVVTLNYPMELRLGFGPFAEKLERFETVYPVIRSHGGVVSYVDLSPEGKVVVKYGA